MKKVKFKVTIQDKGKTTQFMVGKDEFVIGRGKDADVVVSNDLISRSHLKVSFSDDKIWIEELGSSNGSWYADKKMTTNKRVLYRPEERLIVGGKLGLSLHLDALEEVNQYSHEEFWENTKVANGPAFSTPRPVPQAPIKLVQEDRIEDHIIDIKNQAEKALFMQIKNLLGTEAEAIRNACLDEATRIKKSAEHYSNLQYREAKEKSDKLLKDTEEFITRKISELKRVEADAVKRLEGLRAAEAEADQHVTELKASEAHYQHAIKVFEEKIQNEENRIQEAALKIEENKQEYQTQKTQFDTRVEEFNLEERRFKARMETELLEAKMRITQMNGDVERISGIKAALEPEVQKLKLERTSLEDHLHSLKLSKREEEHTLEGLKKEWNNLKFTLEDAQRTVTDSRRETEQKEQEYAKWVLEIKKCEEEKQQVLEDARKQSESILETARLEAERSIQKVQSQIEDLNHQKENLESDVEKERQKLTAQLEASMKKLYDKKADLIKEIERMAVSSHEEYHRAIQQSKEDSEKIVLEGKAEAQKFLDEAQAKIDVKHKEQLAAIAELEARKVALAEEEESARKDILSRKEAMENEISVARNQQEKIISDARAEAEAILKRNEAEAEILRKTMVNGAEAQVNAILADIENKAREARKREETHLAELKHAEMLKLKKMRSEAEEEWIDKRTERAKAMATNIYALVAGEMFKHQNQSMNIEFIESFSKELKEKVVDTMLDRIGADTDKLQEILKTGEDAKNKEKIFWKKVQISVGATAFLILLLSIFPQIITGPKKLIVNAFTEKGDNGSGKFLEQVQEARKKFAFTPLPHLNLNRLT